MKLHLDGMMKLGKFEVVFKTLELKLKVEREVVMLHVRPRKVGFVLVNNDKVVHVALSFLAAHLIFTYHK